MVELTSRDEIEAWLKTRPREDAVVLAARAALRVAPLLVTALDVDAAKRRAAILLPCLRALAVPWCAGTWPHRGTEIRAAARVAAYIPNAVEDAVISNTAAAAAAAATDAAHVVVDPATAFIVATADSAASATTFGICATTLSADATALEDGLPAPDLARRPLWPAGIPDWAAEHWQKLRAHLDAAPEDENWWVWTTWYQARLDGAPAPVEDLELARVLIPDETWDQGPKAVNAEIARLIARHLPAQITAALAAPPLQAAYGDFRHDPETGRMEMVPFAGDLTPVSDPARIADRAELLASLATLCPALADDLERDTSNAPPHLAPDLRRYAAEAARGPESARGRVLRYHGNALRGAHDDPDRFGGLTNDQQGKLAKILDLHDELMQTYFAPMLRAVPAKPLALASTGETEAAIVAAADEAAAAIQRDDWGDAPPPPDILSDLAADWTEASRELTRRIDVTGDAETRAMLQRQRAEMAVHYLATVKRYALRAFEYTVGERPLPTMAAGGFIFAGTPVLAPMLSISLTTAALGLTTLVGACAWVREKWKARRGGDDPG